MYFISGVRGAETGDKAGKRSVERRQRVRLIFPSLLSSLPRNFRRQIDAALRGDAARRITHQHLQRLHGGNGQGNDAGRPCSRGRE